ncbi:MAG: ABC transporter substrate-binding protein [Candidatus Aerophobetes bacterium]|nr:ABC transporter substrate-binding protein [Candidatus Aerophobetes bacterium]
MKNSEKIGVAILIMILVSTVFPFSSIEKQTEHRAAEAALAKTEITITDYRGRNVTLPYPVERIVLLQHHAAWAIRLLGVEDKVVGVSKHLSEAGMYPKLSSKPVCGTWQHPNYEEIVQLRPQVVITFHPNPGPGVVEEAARKLEPFSIKIVALRFTQMRTSQFEILAKYLEKKKRLRNF